MLKIDPEQLQTVGLRRVLEYAISRHQPSHSVKLQDYYEGTHAILHRQMLDATKPNNRLVNNLAAYITDTVTGYFMGKPIAYSGDSDDDEAYLTALTEILDANDEQDHNAELAKSQSIKGCAYELLYTDEDANIRFAELARENVIYVESDDVAARPIMAVRIYDLDMLDDDTDDLRRYYDVYTDTEIISFRQVRVNDQKNLVQVGEREHFFGGVPIVPYPNNKELLGDFEGVLTLIDAYNIAQSDTANDFEYFTDAYLKLIGFQFDDESIAAMKENRVIALPDKEGDVDWLIKSVNDTALENYKDRIRRDIHALSKTPNLTDEEFAGNLSGVAISYKLWGLEQLASMKERKFKQGLQRRIELITNILNTQGQQWDWRDIDMTFTRNLPQNLVEIADTVSKLKGIVSDQTLLAQLPFVDDPQGELDRLAEQNEGRVDLDLVEPFTEEPEEEEEPAGEVIDEPRT